MIFLIGAAVLGIGALIAASDDDDDDYDDYDDDDSYEYSTSDEEERTAEAVEEEHRIVEKKAWNSFVSKVNKTNCKLEDKSKESDLGVVVLHGLKKARKAGKTNAPCFSYTPSKLREDVELKSKIAVIDSIILEQLGSIVWDSSSLIQASLIDEELKEKLLEFCPEELVQDLESFIKEASEVRPRLAATGVLKAGKSTMMNCLVGDFTNKRFKTAVVRQTVEEQVYEQDGYIFVDTPGIDANEGDTQIAEKALQTADLVLFVHNMNGGGLDEPERVFLESVQKNWQNPAEFIDKSIIVLTHLDMKEEDSEAVESNVRGQVQDIFGVEPFVVSISSSRYLKGMPEDKPLLVKKSNYAFLNKAIAEKILKAGKLKKKRYMAKAEERAKELQKLVTHIRQDMIDQIVEQKENHLNEMKVFTLKVEKENKKMSKAYSVYLEKVELS